MKLRSWKGRTRLFLWQRRRPLIITLAILLAATLAALASPLALATPPWGNAYLLWVVAGTVIVLLLLALLAD